MANEGAKKRVIKNREFLKSTQLLLIGTNVAYVLFRMVLLWSSFSLWHMAALAMTSVVYATSYFILAQAAKPKYSNGALVDGGLHDLREDLDKKGMIEYTWDMILTTIFVQATTALFSDWFWLLYLLPPSIGTYYLWVKVIYPWISKPDAPQETEEMRKHREKMEAKQGRTRYAKAR